MSDAIAAPAVPVGKSPDDRFPSQAKYIVGNEACERFSYYGVRSILAVYITSVLGRGEDDSTAIIHYFVFANYFTPLLGAWLSDRFWGRYNTILWVSLFYCLGHGVLATSDLWTGSDAKLWCLGAGLGLIALGSGGIKPCVSAFMGDQFKANQSHLLQKAFGAFYWAVNFGSFFSFLVIPWLKDHYGYGVAFGVPGIFMAIATLIFWLGSRHYVRVPPSRETRSAGFLRVLGFAVTHQSSRTPGKGFWDVARSRFSADEVNGAASVGPVLCMFLLILPFWALFDQSSSTWVLQGEQMQKLSLLGWTVNAEQMQSWNPLFVMVLVPLLTLGIYPRLGRWATPLRRMGAGMVVSGASFLVVAWIQSQLEAGHPMSLAWQILSYLILTTGEVLISVTGLEFAFTEASPQMKSTIMSFWYVAIALGNLLVSWVTRLGAGDGHAHAAVSSQRFYFYANLTFAVAVVFIIASMFYRYRNPANARLSGAGT